MLAAGGICINDWIWGLIQATGAAIRSDGKELETFFLTGPEALPEIEFIRMKHLVRVSASRHGEVAGFRVLPAGELEAEAAPSR